MQKVLKFRGLHKKYKNFDKFYHISNDYLNSDSPYVCRTHFLHNVKVKIQNISKFFCNINKRYILIV